MKTVLALLVLFTLTLVVLLLVLYLLHVTHKEYKDIFHPKPAPKKQRPQIKTTVTPEDRPSFNQWAKYIHSHF